MNETLFKNRRGGFFVDVGAHDGKTLSNTLFFERELGWRGICIEPLPARFRELVQNRTCDCLRGCAYHENGTVEFNQVSGYAEMLSGIRNLYAAPHRERLARELAEHGGAEEVIAVKSFRLESVFDLWGIRHVNYLSIDTEGAELQVVQGINFSKVTFDVIEFEQNYAEAGAPVHRHLSEHGFTMWGQLGGEVFYLRNALMQNAGASPANREPAPASTTTNS